MSTMVGGHMPAAKLAASKVAEEVDALRRDAKVQQAGVAALVAKKGKGPAKALDSLAVSVADLRKDVAKFKNATKAAPAEVRQALRKLDKRIIGFSAALEAIPTDRPLSAADANGASASAQRVIDEIDALFGLLEPVVYR